ncbi:transposase, mutator type [Rhodococcus wratislaviensis]|uniref:Mutator family transposase n=1 Tax=Rhodococcus wratislaviensis TaxID=44752 RepID=A0A402C4F1_RHOWR|nr:transposase, mutator type [Rhodococcus wratislaviensis]
MPERRKRAEKALTSVVANRYLLGVSTRRMEKLVDSLRITSLSKSQVSVMAKDLDAQVEAIRRRPLDGGPYPFVAADAHVLVLEVRENGRVVNVHTLVPAGVNAEGYREILGIEVTSAEDGAGWLAFFRSLVARVSGARLVTSGAHAGLVAAIGASLPGAARQRCRTLHRIRLRATCASGRLLPTCPLHADYRLLVWVPPSTGRARGHTSPERSAPAAPGTRRSATSARTHPTCCHCEPGTFSSSTPPSPR